MRVRRSLAVTKVIKSLRLCSLAKQSGWTRRLGPPRMSSMNGIQYDSHCSAGRSSSRIDPTPGTCRVLLFAAQGHCARFSPSRSGRILKPDARQTHQVTSTGSVQLQIPPKDTHSGSTSSPPSLAELAAEACVAPNLSGSRLLKFNSPDSPECGHPGTYAAGHVSRGRSGAGDRAGGARRRVAYRTGWRQRCGAGLSRWECVRERGRE